MAVLEQPHRKGEITMQGNKGALIRGIIIAIVLATVGWQASAADKKEPPEDKIAVVNGAVITRSEFDRAVSFGKQRALQTGQPLDDARLKERILKQLVGSELLYQRSEEHTSELQSH